MSDYKELVEQLKDYSCCRKGEIAELTAAAAAAIEDMEKHITEMHERVTVLQIARGELEAEVKRLNMRCADCEYASKPWPELEPKRGEWEVKGANRIDCSVCGHSVCFAFGLIDGSLGLYKYCPNCGAKMEVQDGKRCD